MGRRIDRYKTVVDRTISLQDNQAYGRLPHLQLIYDTAPIGLAFLTPDCRYLHINARLTEICGIPVAGHIGRSVRETVPLVADQVERIVQTIVRTGEPITGIEVNGQRQDGSNIDRVWITHWHPLKNPTGDVIGVNVAAEEITSRKQAQDRIAADLQDMTRLSLLANQLVREGGDVDKSLAAVLETAIAIVDAEKGNMQLFDADSSALTIVVQRGFEKPFLEFFEDVRNDAAACAVAMRSGGRVIVEDVQRSEIFAGQPSKDVLIDAGVRAVISTPLMSSTGNLLGMISTHFGKPHKPEERELHLMDLLTRLAADYLERKRAEEVQDTLIREVQHRSNNLLAVIQTIANRSLSGDFTLAQAKAAFEARLHALARANRSLTKSNWMGADLKDIVRVEMQPYAERTIVHGSSIILTPKHAQNFSLALHELATNAVKYGSFSNGRGKVGIFWTVSRQGQNNSLEFKWREIGGPPVNAPIRLGFGTTLLKATFPEARIDYAAEGLRCEIDVLLGEDRSTARS